MVCAKNWKRLLGLFLDLIIVDFIITKPLSSRIESVIPEAASFSQLISFLKAPNLIFISFLIGFMGVLYWTILEYKIGQTLGGLVFNLKVKSLDNRRFTMPQIFLRNLSKISLVLLIIDSIHILFSDKKQRFLEKLSRTYTEEI